MWKAVLFTDVDGVLCNGVYYLDNGIRARRFSPIDGHGFHLLKENGILPIILSGESDECIFHRANKLGVDFIPTKDKSSAAAEYLIQNELDRLPVAFIGDDLPDLLLMKQVDFVGCPRNAQPEIKGYVTLRCNEGTGHVCRNKGGENAFREFCEIVLSQ